MEDKNELKQTEAVEENGEAVKSDSSKKNTLKNLLQLVIFILLSMRSEEHTSELQSQR